MGTFNAGAGCRLAQGDFGCPFSAPGRSPRRRLRELVGQLEGNIARLKPTLKIISSQSKNPRAAPAARGFLFGVRSAASNESARARRLFRAPQRQNPTGVAYGVLRNKSLTMTYFHRRPSTIIGAKAFHCPVRDGKEWYHLAMVVRRNWLRDCPLGDNRSNLGRSATCGGSEASSMIPHSGCNWCWLAADGAARFCIERHLERYTTRS